uniref:Uncharacterized protein n=1 Tax=Chromera velia CCMP2878 TaxID=1169474 RepID=A0A0G4G199_9ALVE|eukprot:Cvel_19678.t1-p1 / transcript=Cvel_19678.t1 / gene=Cvel_19678 / organism=Chromera_velia_CCMP2878 / gene_product=hypothetical protein / transcript_product=hypothetical protein / location=Cvel_scaffold1716:5834-9466(+) / protein_length=414 / sequence_SO=supercontig / SO=protein_coding / is_pseudo=false
MIEGARNSTLSGAIGAENPKRRGNSETGTEETASVDLRDESLNFFMHRMKLNPQSLSDLATRRESFGLAWLSAFLKTEERNEVKGIPFEFPRGLDLSGVRGLSPEEIYILLNALPSSVEEIKLDSRAVRGRALPLLLNFLKRVAAGREGKTEAPRLKSFTFAENSMGPEEASQVLPLLLPSLEHLCLKGNPLGSEGIRAVAGGVKEGNAASLRVLDLEATGLKKEGLETLCEAMREKSMRVETLNLSGNAIRGVEEMEGLCSVLCVSSLPSLREFLARECGLTDKSVKPLTESMARRDLPNLEVLDLGGNNFVGGFLGDLGGALRVGGVPRLRELRVNDAMLSGSGQSKGIQNLGGIPWRSERSRVPTRPVCAGCLLITSASERRGSEGTRCVQILVYSHTKPPNLSRSSDAVP